jgi:hypothetical protein
MPCGLSRSGEEAHLKKKNGTYSKTYKAGVSLDVNVNTRKFPAQGYLPS